MGCLSERIIICLTGSWTIVLGLLYGAMALTAIFAHNCDYSMSHDPINYLIYLVYFRRTECGPVEWNLILKDTPNVLPVIELPEVTDVAFRTNVIAYTYFVLCCIWVVTSVMLILSSCAMCFGRCCYYILFLPWIITSSLKLVLDAVATGFFIHDIVHTATFDGLLTLIELNPDDVQTLSEIGSQVNPWIPSTIFASVASKGIIFWSLNVFLVVYICGTLHHFITGIPKSRKNKKTYKNHHRQQNQPNREQNRNSSNLAPIEQRHPQTNDYERQQPYNRFNDPPYEYNDSLNQTDDESVRSNRMLPIVTIQKQMQNNGSYSDDTLSAKAHSVDSLDEMRNPSAMGGRTNKSSVEHLIVNENRSPGPHKTGYSNPTFEDMRSSIQQAQNRPVNKEVLKNPYSQERDEELHSRQTISPPDELRSQLPWSYIQSWEEVKGPKKAFNELRDDEELPPVPVPDYTLHFPKKDRPSTSDIDGKWSGPEIRY